MFHAKTFAFGFGLSVAGTCFIPIASATPGMLDYYVGLDGRPDLTGALVNYTNPNLNRLTLLYAHDYPSVVNPTLDFTSNHFHRLGAYSYQVPAGSPIPVPAGQSLDTFFTNARTPEGTRPPIKLVEGTGLFVGKFISTDRPESLSDASTEYDNIRIASIHTMRALAGTDPGSQAAATNPFQAMYYSSRFGPNNTPRYTGSMTGAQVGLKLIAATPGLEMYEPDGDRILASVGDVQLLGEGDTFDYSFVFAVDAATRPLTEFNATFQLVDLATDNPLPDSGQFTFALAVIPEPATLGLIAAGALVALRRTK